uniref:Family with sequence similarity 171 member B n=1 Tax=Lates calcarifer TaxID=8187 RepID=A0A4W6CYT4_LATCA
QFLSQALVEVYINYSRAHAALTGEDGAALLRVPYQSGLPITLVASRHGYIYTLLPCKTIFSSVTMSLLRLNQGNIWLFEDSVLITGKTSGTMFRRSPVVQFPKSLLNLTDSRNVTSVKAYLTIPQLEVFQLLLNIVSCFKGYVSVDLSPVAAVSVQLFSGDTELHVSGPIQISLSIPDRPSDSRFQTKGLGKVVSVDGKLLWTFTAPHLGYWIAAPLSPTRGFFGLAVPIDFILRHSSLLMLLLGGMLLVVVCLLVGLLYYLLWPIMLECTDLDLNSDPSDVIRSGKSAEQMRVAASLTENLFFYNQPVAILHAPAFFHLDEGEELPQWSKSATLPRAGASNGGAAEPPSKDSFTQTLPKGLTQNQEVESEEQLGAVAVPGTLNKIRDSRHSVHALAELSKIPSPQPPRAWFVSLEGKPAAEIHYAVSEQQRRRRPVESRETSLDSGVDMSELNQSSGRRPVTLERNATFVKSSSSSKHTPPHHVISVPLSPASRLPTPDKRKRHFPAVMTLNPVTSPAFSPASPPGLSALPSAETLLQLR